MAVWVFVLDADHEDRPRWQMNTPTAIESVHTFGSFGDCFRHALHNGFEPYHITTSRGVMPPGIAESG